MGSQHGGRWARACMADLMGTSRWGPCGAGQATDPRRVPSPGDLKETEYCQHRGGTPNFPERLGAETGEAGLGVEASRAWPVYTRQQKDLGP